MAPGTNGPHFSRLRWINNDNSSLGSPPFPTSMPCSFSECVIKPTSAISCGRWSRRISTISGQSSMVSSERSSTASEEGRCGPDVETRRQIDDTVIALPIRLGRLGLHSRHISARWPALAADDLADSMLAPIVPDVNPPEKITSQDAASRTTSPVDGICLIAYLLLNGLNPPKANPLSADYGCDQPNPRLSPSHKLGARHRPLRSIPSTG